MLFRRVRPSPMWRASSRLCYSTSPSPLKMQLSRSLTGNHFEFNQTISKESVRRVFLAVGSIMSVSTLGYIYADEGLRRSAYFVANVSIPLMKYKWAEYRTSHLSAEEKSKHFAPLHKQYCNEPLRIILELKGFYIKIGQVMSTLGDADMPKEYLESLRILQSDVPPRPFSRIKKIVESEFGCKLDDLFLSFEEKPIGAASIGQVHRAVLKDGTPVVVKVQYPEVEEYFYMDFVTLKYFCKIAQPDQLLILEEIEKNFVTEFDYTKEAEALRKVAENMACMSSEVAIPLPIDEKHPSNKTKGGMCRKKVLTMTYLKGESLQKKLNVQLEQYAKLNKMSVDELKAKFKAQMEQDEAAGKTGRASPPSSLIKGFLFTRDLIKNTWALYYNITWGILFGNSFPYEHSEPPIDAQYVNQVIFDAHAHQLFVDGYFNGDPHPGNIMILDDGRVGLIDFGQTKSISIENRVIFAKLILAIKANNTEKIVKLMKDIGIKTEKMDPWVLEKYARFDFDDIGPKVTAELGGIALFSQNLDKRDKLLHIPSGTLMPVRMLLLIRMNALQMGLGYVSGVKMMEKYATEFLQRQHISTDVSTF